MDFRVGGRDLRGVFDIGEGAVGVLGVAIWWCVITS